MWVGFGKLWVVSEMFWCFVLGSLTQATFIDMISLIVSMSIFQHVVSHGLQLGHKFPYHDVQHILWNHRVIINFVARFCGARFHSPIVFMRFHASNVAVIWYLDVAVWNTSKCTIQRNNMQWFINHLILVEFEGSTLSMIKGSCHSSDDQTKFADWKQVKVK